MPPSLPEKIFFWIVLGSFSVFLAEVIAGSSPFPFFTVPGLLLVLPLYLLHIVVLGTVAIRWGAGRFAPLFLCGMIFGMYEAYITKVLWSGWTPPAVTVGGVAVVEFLVLVFWWHPIFAFLLPLLSAEILCTDRTGPGVRLPGWLERGMEKIRDPIVLVVMLAAVMGIITGFNDREPGTAFLSVISSGLVVAGLVWIWRRTITARYSLAELLPKGREWYTLLGALLFLYTLTTILLLPERLPPLPEQAIVWILYAVLLVLLYRSITKGGEFPPAGRWYAGMSITGRTWFAGLAALAIAAAVSSLIVPPGAIVALFIAGILIGMMFFAASIRELR